MKLVHIAKTDEGLLFLREEAPNNYAWFSKDEKTPVEAPTIPEAIRLAYKYYALDHFQPLLCGYKFTLPERDEHGNNALFQDMVQSLNSMNGIYFDDKLGYNCIVHQIPLASRELYEKLKKKISSNFF